MIKDNNFKILCLKNEHLYFLIRKKNLINTRSLPTKMSGKLEKI